jgi:hypothetical protein
VGVQPPFVAGDDLWQALQQQFNYMTDVHSL